MRRHEPCTVLDCDAAVIHGDAFSCSPPWVSNGDPGGRSVEGVVGEDGHRHLWRPVYGINSIF